MIRMNHNPSPRRVVIAAGWPPRFRADRAVDFVMVNRENAADGPRITMRIALNLLSIGAHVTTTGRVVRRAACRAVTASGPCELFATWRRGYCRQEMYTGHQGAKSTRPWLR